MDNFQGKQQTKSDETPETPETPETKEKILLAAKHEFANNGFAGARVGMIAQAAGVNKAMLFYYFGNKEQLYHEVLIQFVGSTPKHEIFDLIQKERLSPPDTLAHILYFMIRIHFELIDPDFHRLISWDIAEGKKNIHFLFANYFAPGMEKLEGVIKSGIESGYFETQYPIFVVWHFISFLVAYISQNDMFAGTPVYERLHLHRGKDAMTEYLIHSVFQILRPVNAPPLVPELEGGLKKKLDLIIEEMKAAKKDVKKYEENK